LSKITATSSGALRLQAEAPAAVIIDTLNRSIAGSESDDKDMAAYIRAADAIRDAFKCAVIVVHHCGIDATRPRGHTSLTGAVDAQLAVKRDAADLIVVTTEWMKDGLEGDIVTSRLEVVDVGTDEDGETISSCVVVPVQAGLSGASDNLKGAVKVALDALREAIAEAGEQAPASNHIPPGTRTTRIDVWRRYCDAKMIAETDKPDSKRKAFVRAAKRLQDLHIIGVWNDEVWIVGHTGQ